MSYFKNKIIDVMEMLENTGMDFDRVSQLSGLSVSEVAEIAQDYMGYDFETMGVAYD
jgi:predicted transcriptional regulator